MLSDLLLGLGLVAVLEGLVLALAPHRLEEVLRQLAQTPKDSLRIIGLAIVTIGVILVLLARS